MKDETIVLHHGHRRGGNYHICYSTNLSNNLYQFNNTEHAAKLFSLEELGKYLY